MSTHFNHDYALYYDLLYSDKDYYAETEYIDSLIKKHSSFPVSSILNLGCGTGNHDFFLSNKGYTITGVDASASMISIAKKKNNVKKTKITFLHGDARKIRLDIKFDAAIALFHLLSYQNSDEDVLKTFKTVSVHLKKNGIFIFDCWNAQGVLNDLPTIREKKFENEAIRMKRIAVPHIHYQKNIVDVNYTLTILNKETGRNTYIKEKHPMRYFFTSELETFCERTGFTMLNRFAWLTEVPPDKNTWNAVYVLRCN